MIKRVVEIANPARLSLANGQLIVEREGAKTASIPVEDMGILILDHPAIVHTQRVFEACYLNNVVVLVCGGNHMPGAMLLPLDGNALQTKTIAGQVNCPEPVRKRLWQAVVKAKVSAQAYVLKMATGEAGPLERLPERVRSGDPDNVEAQAARIYWLRLFGDEFRRERDEVGVNSMLNYGYAIVRSAIARAIVATGLHPSIGIHHRNQYNAFCLAEDLVEPLRPCVDMLVYEMSRSGQLELELSPKTKKSLLAVLNVETFVGNRKLPLMLATHYYAASVRKVICGEESSVEIPQL